MNLIKTIILLLTTLASCKTAELVNTQVYTYVCDINELEDEMLFASTDTIVYNVKFIELNYVDEKLSYNKDRSIEVLNQAFAKVPIKFQRLESENFYPMASMLGAVINYKALFSAYNELDNITIVVIPNDLQLDIDGTPGSVQGVAGDIPNYNNPQEHLTGIIIREANADWNILVHEMGHLFGLPHPFGLRRGYLPGNGCYTGDGIPDTPVPAIGHGTIMPGCKYRPGVLDTLSADEQKIYLRNFMGYGHPSCMEEFTDGQNETIRKFAESNWPLKLARVKPQYSLYK